MFRRHVLAALAAGIAARDDDAARATLRGVDPVARRFARRRFERSLIDAALSCDAAQLAAPSPTHVMQVAALAQSRRSRDVDAADGEAVAAAYARLPVTTIPRFPLWTLLTMLLVAALGAGVAVFIATQPSPASRTYVRAMPPPSADAFVKGGAPLRDAAIDTLFVDGLTDLVVHGGRARDLAANDFEARLKRLRTPDPLRKRGVALALAWDSTLDVFARSVEVARQPDGPTMRQRDDLRESVRELTAQLTAAGLGYFLEGRFKNGYPYIQAYRVVEVVFVSMSGVPRRVLSVRRLDKLNTAYAVLGIHSEDLDDPRLDLDRIDEHVVSDVMPVLSADAFYDLAEHEWLVTDAGKALAALVGDTVRREYQAALGPDAKVVGAIAKLVVKRENIVEGWRDHLRSKKIYFVRTDNLFLPPTLLDQLEDVTPKYERDRVREIEDRLAEFEAPRIHARVHDLVTASVRRHEAQHAFDYDRDTEPRYPEPLAKLLGPSHDTAGEEVAIVRAARHELSAYLSQIANDPVTPQASLWHLGKQVFTRDRWGTGEFYAGIIVLEGLARQLGVEIACCTFRRGLDRERMAKLATAIAKAPADKLHAAANALWSELYGEPVTKIVDPPLRAWDTPRKQSTYGNQ
jgi:hypothetical protein